MTEASRLLNAAFAIITGMKWLALAVILAASALLGPLALLLLAGGFMLSVALAALLAAADAVARASRRS